VVTAAEFEPDGVRGGRASRRHDAGRRTTRRSGGQGRNAVRRARSDVVVSDLRFAAEQLRRTAARSSRR